MQVQALQPHIQPSNQATSPPHVDSSGEVCSIFAFERRGESCINFFLVSHDCNYQLPQLKESKLTDFVSSLPPVKKTELDKCFEHLAQWFYETGTAFFRIENEHLLKAFQALRPDINFLPISKTSLMAGH